MISPAQKLAGYGLHVSACKEMMTAPTKAGLVYLGGLALGSGCVRELENTYSFDEY